MKRLFLCTTALCLVFAGASVSKAEDLETTPNSMPVVEKTDAVVSGPATVVSTDADGNVMTTTTTTYYLDLDKNKNGILDSNEFYSYAYSLWDTDRDGYLSDEEWKLNTVRWYGPSSTEYQTYTYWDKDGDGRIDATEFDTAVATTKLYSVWDLDQNNTIEMNEYAAASFRLYDTDGDGSISLDEWKAAL